MPATAYEKHAPSVNDSTAEVSTSTVCFFKEQSELISKKQNLDKNKVTSYAKS